MFKEPKTLLYYPLPHSSYDEFLQHHPPLLEELVFAPNVDVGIVPT